MLARFDRFWGAEGWAANGGEIGSTSGQAIVDLKHPTCEHEKGLNSRGCRL